MINYDSKNWISGIAHFKKSYIIRKTLRIVLGSGAFTALVAVFHFWVMDLSGDVFDTMIFSLLGIFLSLLMAFRNNTAYDRYWEGRKQWGALINHTRGLAVLMNGILRKEDFQNRDFFARAIAAFSHALSQHLRNINDYECILHYSDELESDIRKIKHVPNKIVNDLYQRIEILYKDEFLDGNHLINIKPEIQSFLDIQGACERIKATPVPFSHNFFIKLFISVYIILLPFVVVPMAGFWSILIQMFVTYALVGLEYISVEIEEPFGMDCNDLPTTQLADKIESNVFEILGVPITQKLVMQKEGNYIVIH